LDVLKIDQAQNNALDLQLLALKVGGQAHFLSSAFHGSLEEFARELHEGLRQIFFLDLSWNS
jgi:hypothetical protein